MDSSKSTKNSVSFSFPDKEINSSVDSNNNNRLPYDGAVNACVVDDTNDEFCLINEHVHEQIVNVFDHEDDGMKSMTISVENSQRQLEENSNEIQEISSKIMDNIQDIPNVHEDFYVGNMVDSENNEIDPKIHEQANLIVEKIIAHSLLRTFNSNQDQDDADKTKHTQDGETNIEDHVVEENDIIDDDENDKVFNDQNGDVDDDVISDDNNADVANPSAKKNQNNKKRNQQKRQQQQNNSNKSSSPKKNNNKSTSNKQKQPEVTTGSIDETIIVEVQVEELKDNQQQQQLEKNSTEIVVNSEQGKVKTDKMNGVKSYGSNHLNGGTESTICKICSKHVYHMEQIKAVKAIFHKSCFRCIECNKQLNMDSYSSHEGQIYCKPHFKQLFQPKPNFDNNNNNQSTNNINHNHLNGSESTIDGEKESGQSAEKNEEIKSKEEYKVEDSTTKEPPKRQTSRKYELIICENQPIELPPDVVRYDQKQQDIFENLTLDLSNIRNRFENGSVSSLNNGQDSANSNNHHHHQNNNHHNKPIARSESIHKIMQKYQSRVAGDNCVSSSSDEEDNVPNGNSNNNDSSTEKVSFSGMSTLKSQWETCSINNNSKQSDSRSVENELAELRKKSKNSEPLKQVYERAVQEAKSMENLNKSETPVLPMESSVKAGSIKEKFEKGAVDGIETEEQRIERLRKEREAEITQISCNDAALKEARNKFKQIEMGNVDGGHQTENSSSNGHLVDEVSINSEQLQQRFNYFENFNGNVKSDDEHDGCHHSKPIVDDIPKVDTTKKMLSKFKALEAGQQVNGSDHLSLSPMKPSPKRITPPRETTAKVQYENEPLVERDPNIVKASYKCEDVIQVEPEKAKHLRAKFENWQTEIERENRKNLDDDDFVPLERDTTKNLRAMFESIQNTTSKPVDKPRPRVNRFVEKQYQQQSEQCYVCSQRIYPMEKMEFSGIKLHKNCFRCTKCHMPLRLDNFTQHADKLFCIPHFKQLFMEKGNYDEGFGLEQHKDKWSNKSASSTSVNGAGSQTNVSATNTNGGMASKSAPSTPATTNGKLATKTNGHHNNHHDSEDDEHHHQNIEDISDGPLDSIEDNFHGQTVQVAEDY